MPKSRPRKLRTHAYDVRLIADDVVERFIVLLPPLQCCQENLLREERGQATDHHLSGLQVQQLLGAAGLLCFEVAWFLFALFLLVALFPISRRRCTREQAAPAR